VAYFKPIDCAQTMMSFFSRLRASAINFATPVSLIGAIFCVAITFSGGTSRADALSQVVVRVASIFTIAALLVRRPTFDHLGRVRPMLIFTGLIGVLIILQLVPLPPAAWTALPGRVHDVELAKLIDAQGSWRPMNLTPDLGWNAAMALLPVFATIALLAHVDRQHRSLPITIVGVIAVSSAVLGLAQLTDGPDSWLRFYEITSQGSAVGLLANRNHNATLLAASLPVIAFAGARLDDEHRDQRLRILMALAASLILLIMIPITGSRFGLVAGTIGLTSSALWWVKPLNRTVKRASRHAKRLILSSAFIVAVSAVALALTSDRAQAIQRLFAANIAQDQRLTIGPILWKMVGTFFPVGSGFGSFEPVFRRFEPISNLSDEYLNQAHNDLIQIVIEGGMPAILFLGIFLFWWIRKAFLVWRDRDSTKETELARLGTIVTAIILTSSLVDYPLRTSLIAAVFTVATWCMTLHRSGRVQRGDD
jgi:hypothetical protein